MLDDTTPFQDYSGYARAGIMDTGSPPTGAPLVAGAAFSQIFSNAIDAKFDTPVFIQGYEKQAFTLETSFRVIEETGTTSIQKVLSTASNYDGITVNGTIIKFSTKYLTAGECAVSYDTQIKRNVHVVGVHTTDKNQLFVDGVLVGETSLTEAQKADSYVATDGKLWMGTSASAQKVAVNGVSIYATALSDKTIKEHFTSARRTIMVESVTPTFSGARFPMSLSLSNTFLRQSWSADSDWSQGAVSNVTVVNNQLVPQLIAGVSVAGTWQGVLPLDCGKTSVYGVFLNWDAYGAVVEASLDGTTWETAVRGKKLTTTPDTFNPTNKELFIRISFAGGVSDDPGYVNSLTAIGLTTGVTPDVAGRTITFTEPASPMNEYQPIEHRDDWGVRLQGGSVVISADGTTTPPAIYSLNVWIKKTTSTTPTFSTSGMTAYKNGAAGGTLNEGEWAMYTLTKATALTGSITISGQGQIGQIELFDHQLTAQEVADLYTASTGVPVLRTPESDALAMTNPNPSTRIYSYAWSITGAG